MDRLDYLRRDSFFTGVTEGNIGSARIIKMLNVVDDALVVESNGIYSIENYLTSRRLMYWQVYLHKTTVGCENVLITPCTVPKHWQQRAQSYLLPLPYGTSYTTMWMLTASNQTQKHWTTTSNWTITTYGVR